MKKLIKVLFSFLMLALLGGSGYIMYDYTKNPEKYDEFSKKFQDKITGKENIPVEEVSPFVTPEMTLTLENSPYEGEAYVAHEDYAPDKPLIMCYGKDMGGNIYVPRNFHVYQSASLYSGPDVPERDITEYVSQNIEFKCIEISEELLMSLEAGEYYIVAEFMTEEGWLYPALIPLIVEEETTFNSVQSGVIVYGDEYFCVTNDIENPKEISFTFYNLGDNPIRALVLPSDIGNGYLYTEANPDDYYINERGDTVTLKTEYLQSLIVNTKNRYAVRLANGEVLTMESMEVCTVRGDSLNPLVISGPDTYSLSKGGDYVATYEPNLCDSIYSCGFDHFPVDREGFNLFDETLRGEDIGIYLDMDTQTITIPEEIMKQIPPNDGNSCIYIGYYIKDCWFDAHLIIQVTD